MANSITVSDATVLAARDAQMNIGALKQHIKLAKNTPQVFAILLVRLDSLEEVLQRILPASDATPARATQEVQSYLCSNISDCARACDEFEKVFRGFVDQPVDGTAREFDRFSFGIIGEFQVQLLNKRLDRWKKLVFNAVEFSLLRSLSMLANIHQEQNTALLTMESDMSNLIKEMDWDNYVLREKWEMLNGIVREVFEQTYEIEDSQNFLDVLRTEIHWLRTGQRIKTQNSGRLFRGTTKPFRGSGQINQRIENVHVDGKGIVGIAKGFDINAWFKD